MLTFVRGNLFEYPADIRVNTVNCVGVMGTGVALAAKKLYPKMFLAYKEACLAGEIQPGRLNIWKTGSEWIINFPTKRHWRDKSRYEDIEAGLLALKSYLKSYGQVRVAIPALGCGHGGLEWERVSSMIRHHLADLDAKLFVFEPADSVSAGEQFSSPKRPNQPRGHKAKPIRVDVGSHSSFLKHGINQVFLLGSSDLLFRTMLTLATPSKPSEKEKNAAAACMKSIARHGLTVSFSCDRSDWRTLSKYALSQGADALLWTAGGIGRVKVPPDLAEYLSDGRLAIASIFDATIAVDSATTKLTNSVQGALSQAILITARGMERSVHEIVEHSRGKPLFFVNYQEAFPEDVRWLKSAGGQPVGRHSSDGSPNVSTILHALLPHQ
ncbi:macro domain-containing protein [Pyxidicoccus xibeiensis]|uniref:macro domain-containing protein n=1 Tax=Pyxidicoccus xibeiensis TaxID=2906759 RepID=UPI0020A7D5EA|nr:macro domain-containing protein [Pyxidicoccus xibeiensis]MCP3138181.1 macro domain-containing protein [Pyxidicoccus xibeiensis]